MNVTYHDNDDPKPDAQRDFEARRGGSKRAVIEQQRIQQLEAVLREFVTDNEWLGGEAGMWYCNHCDGAAVRKVSEFVHEPGCKVVRGRKLLGE